jgi:hypothetical protein
MWTTATSDTKQPADYQFRRVTIDLGRGDIRQEMSPAKTWKTFSVALTFLQTARCV